MRLIRERPEVVLSPLVFVVIVLTWHAAVVGGLVSPFVLPSPLDIGQVLAQVVVAPWFIPNVTVTVTEVLVAFALATVVGISLGLLFAQVRSLRRLTYPYVVLFQVTPTVALAPILISVFGFGLESKIALGFAIAVFPVIVHTMAGLDRVPRNSIRLMASLGASSTQQLTMLGIPFALPEIFAGLKVGATLALVGVLVGEFILATTGLGVRLVEFSFGLKLRQVWAIVIVICFIGIAAYLLVALVEKRAIRWR